MGDCIKISMNKCRTKRKAAVKRMQERLNIIILAGKVKSKIDLSELKAHINVLVI